jgi:dethiobiotin synthetase
MSALFVTATGTDIGKTFVAAGLIRHLRQQGKSVEAIKPVVSGFDPHNGVASDPGRLLAALGRPVTASNIGRISPWRFKAPLAPDLAAEREGRKVDYQGVLELSRREAERQRDLCVIEGVGGVMVPLDARHTVLDWMTALKVPALIVAGSYLGTISHTLTALEAVQKRDLRVAAIVVSETPESPVTLDETVAAIARFSGAVPVIGLLRLPAETSEHPAFARIAELV